MRGCWRRLLDSEAYQGLGAAGIALIPAKAVTVPPGYLPVPLDNRRAVSGLIARFPDVTGFLWAEVAYTLVKKNTFHGTVTAAMRADLTLTVLDRTGRGILRHTESAEDPSDMRIPAISYLKLSDVSSAAFRATSRASALMARWLEGKSVR